MPGDRVHMIRKSDALVLRVNSFSRTSRIITWLTPGFGKVVTVMKGACRPKSIFLGQYDLYYTCELVFYATTRRGLHIAKECLPLALRPAFRSDWKAQACAAYFCDVAASVAIEDHDQSDLYHLMTASLAALCLPQTDRRRLLLWFEVRLADLLGISPHLRTCTLCGALPQTHAPLFFSSKAGGVLCKRCTYRPDDSPIPVGHDILAILSHWQESDSPRSAQVTRCSEGQVKAIDSILGAFLKYHLDRVPESRYRVLETVNFGTHLQGDNNEADYYSVQSVGA
jgi:DNA repair protein RecO (recombination protein O)